MGEIHLDIHALDSGVSTSQVGQQITAAAAPSVDNQLCYVMGDGGADEGVYVRFNIPQNGYGTSPQLRIKGILDGAPSAGDDLAFGFRKRAVADNESADGTFDAEQTAQNTDISGWSDEDIYEETISLTQSDYAGGDTVFGYVYLDSSGTTYVGNFLLTDVIFEFTDA